MRFLRLAIILASWVTPIHAEAQIRFVSPGTAAAEGIERRQLCDNILRAGGRCPDQSVPLSGVSEYYSRLVDAQWAAMRAAQEREMAQAQLEQRFKNALTSALQLQELQFRSALGEIQGDLADLRRQLDIERSAASNFLLGEPKSAAGRPPVASSQPRYLDLYDSPRGTYRRFSADELAALTLTNDQPSPAISDRWVYVRLRNTNPGAEHVGYVETTNLAEALP